MVFDWIKAAEIISFHSIGIPSEWGPCIFEVPAISGFRGFPFNWDPQRVGTPCPQTGQTPRTLRFHSIGIPSEWGLQIVSVPPGIYILFPFNWDPQRVGTTPPAIQLIVSKNGFHSIGIPSEWGL